MIWRISMATTLVTAVAGNFAGNWNGDFQPALQSSIYPYSLLVDPTGSLLFVTDWATRERVRQVTLTLTLTASAPTPQPTTYPLGNVYSLQGRDGYDTLSFFN